MLEKKAKNYWSLILKEGFQWAATAPDSSDNGALIHLPEFYNRELFDRGHKFVNENVFAVFVGQVTGMLAMLAVKCYLDDIKITTRWIFATDSLNTHLRIMKHTFDLYQTPPEDQFEALMKYRTIFLNSMNGAFMTQRDIALCQFAFCGYIINRRIDMTSTADDLEGLNHYWRVVGYCMGLEDRFNLCAGSVNETSERIRYMTPNLFDPAFMRSTYEKIISDFVDTFWYLNPFISNKSVQFLSNRLAGVPNREPYELNSPKNHTFEHLVQWKDKIVIKAVISMLDRYESSRWLKWFLNSLVWFGRFCICKLSFMVVGLGFTNSYVGFWTMRRSVLRNLNSCKVEEKRRRIYYVDPKERLNSN